MRSRLIVSITCLFCLSVAFALPAANEPTAAPPLVLQPSPAAIAVVHTADELAAQPVIQTNFGPAHLGIDTATPLAYGSVTLYFLFDAPPPVRPPGPPPPGTHVTIGLSAALHPNAHGSGDFRGLGVTVPHAQAATRFLAHSLFGGPPGDYLLEVRIDEEDILAHATIHVAQAEADRWLPLTGQLPSNVDPAPTYKLSLRPAGPDFTLALSDPPTGALPTATVPATPSDGLQIQSDGNRLTIPHWPAPAFIPEEQLLAAFYINGQRYIPPLPATPTGGGGHFNLGGRNTPFSLTLALDRSSIGAKPTDKVEVELLCAPAGRADFVSGDRFARFGVSGPITRSNRVTLSNAPATQP